MIKILEKCPGLVGPVRKIFHGNFCSKKGFFIKFEKLWSVRLDGLFGPDYRSTVASAISSFEAHHCLNTDELPLFSYRNRNGLTNCSLIEMFDVGNVRTKRAHI